MAYTKLSDVIVRELWTNDFIDESPELKNILNSGLLVRNAQLERVVNALDAGQVFELPYIEEPDYSEPAVMDDSTNEITPDGLSWAQQFAILGLYSKAWSEAAIVTALSSDDPVAWIRDKFIAKYWALDLQRRLVASLAGVVAADVANKGQLGVSVADDTQSGQDVLLDADVLIDAKSKVGDKQDGFKYLFVHSKVYADLEKQNLVSTIPDSEELKPIKMYGEFRLIVNDLLPVIQGKNKKKYVSVLAQRGAFAYAEKNLPASMPAIDLYENKLAGNGAGIRTIISRRGLVIHPIGWSFDKSQISGVSPTLADLQNPKVWNLKFRPKNSKFVYAITN